MVTQLDLPAYPIYIGDLADALPDWLRMRHFAGLAILCDEHTEAYCKPRLAPLLPDGPTQWITISSGEAHKQLDTCRIVWEALFAAKANRNWCLLNLGGGVIGDMGGFCASTFKRGIHFAQLPTTLLSQVDASVGGKLGVDYGAVKNSIGLFRDPGAVFIDPAFLQTLPAAEIRSGYAEIIKHALIADAKQWQQLQGITDLTQPDWATIIPSSLAIKRDIVLADPHERGIRKALNFGHTVGHAIEGYRLHTSVPMLHGEAIAVGMICEAWLSHRLAGLSAEALAQITDYLLRLYGHEPIPEEQFDYLLSLMQQDKKNEDDRINVSLLPAIGTVRVNQIAAPALLRESLLYYNRSR